LKIIICSGGTGGHIFPAIALFEAAKQKGLDATLVTDARGDVFCENVSKKIVLDSVRFLPKSPFKTARRFLSAFWKFLKFYLKKRPDAVVGFGGIFTIAPLIAAKILGSKVVVYEQNSIVGKANKFLEKFADLRFASFKFDEKWTKVAAPVRSEFFGKKIPYKCDGIVKILVIGGSQGAASFSNIIPRALETLSAEERKNIEIIQQENHGNVEKLERVYENLGVKATIKKFVYDAAEKMLNSQLAICRSGASTLSELSAIGRPAILIPYPNATDNHQFWNAKYYEDKGAAWVLEEKDGIAEKLGKLIRRLLQNRELLKNAAAHMINDSADRAADNFIELIKLSRGGKK
jgi:UDP-N-acetylglucosamine--N-acetylmuramyl-(pentapeptide) pyrophosphoryl-undecaprenol N-acetylglucosamine transferase